MINVRLRGGNRESFTGKLGGISWKNGKAVVTYLTQRLIRGYGVVEDETPVETTISVGNITEIKKVTTEMSTEIVAEPEDVIHEIAPVDPEEIFANGEVNDNGASDLARIIAAKKQEIEQAASKDTNETSSDIPKNPLTGDTLKKSEVKSLDDFKGVGSWGKYKSYVKEVTGISPRNKKECAEALSNFIATLED